MNLAATLCAFAAVLYLAVRGLLEGLVQLACGNALPPAAASLVQMLANVLAMALPFALLRWLPLQDTTPQKRRHRRGFLGKLFLLFWGFALAGNLLSGVLAGLEQSLPDRVVLPGNGAGLAMAWLAVCLVPAVGEELLFRGLMLGWLRPYGAFSAIVGQAVLFALLHGRLSACSAAFFGGIALGLVAHYSGGLRLGMVLHLYNNTLAFVGQYAQQYAASWAIVYYALLLGAPLVALFSVLTARTKGDNPPLKRLPRQRFWLAKCPAWAICVAMLGAFCLMQTWQG